MDTGLNYSTLQSGEDKGDGMHAEPILVSSRISTEMVVVIII